MKREYPDRPMIGVGAVVVREGRALVVQRATEPLKGEWSVPGGLLELGETLRQGVVREAAEETGLAVEATDVLEVFDGIHQDPDGRTRYHYVLIDFLCRPLGGELRAGGDAADVRWVTLEELGCLKMADSARRVITKALKTSSSPAPEGASA
jgi:ADP-ribose pyrophosphatase YjhB (NUDIX family)